jgi:hypothetical protein
MTGLYFFKNMCNCSVCKAQMCADTVFIGFYGICSFILYSLVNFFLEIVKVICRKLAVTPS